jgi:hypothetical protein
MWQKGPEICSQTQKHKQEIVSTHLSDNNGLAV